MALAADSLRAIAAARGVSVTLTRGGSSVSVTAVVGESTVERETDNGGLTSFRTTDFLILASDYGFGAGAVEPANNDKVTWGGRVYVARLGPGVRVFDYSDAERSVIRLRTVQAA